MKLKKKGLSIILTLSMVCSMTPFQPGKVVLAAEPWQDGVNIDSAASRSNLERGRTYFSGDEWKGTDQNYNIVQVNREEAHSSETLPYQSVEVARQSAVDFTPEKSQYYKLLTGEGKDWRLAVYKNVDEAKNAGVDGGFYKDGYNEPGYNGNNKVGTAQNANYGGFKTVTLPASWQLQGFDFPIYWNLSFYYRFKYFI